jgi:hypothetical protein
MDFDTVPGLRRASITFPAAPPCPMKWLALIELGLPVLLLALLWWALRRPRKGSKDE